MESKKARIEKRSYWSCENCRTDKQACRPINRQWPDQKCDRCIETNKPCGPNKTKDGQSQKAQDQQQTCDVTARDKYNIGEGCSANLQTPSDNVQKQLASPTRQNRQPYQTRKRSLETEQGCCQHHEDSIHSSFERAGIITKALNAIQATQDRNSRSGVQDDRIDWICQLKPRLKEDLDQIMKALEKCAEKAAGDRNICLADLVYVRIQENLSSLDQARQSEILSRIAAFYKRVGNFLQEERVHSKRSNLDSTPRDHDMQDHHEMRSDSHENISSSISRILSDFVVNEKNATNPFPVSRQFTCNGNSALIFSLVSNAQRRPDILNISEILRRKWIHTAAEEEFQKTFHQLIDDEPDIDAQDIFGVTALSLAASCGNERFCTALLEKGASVGRRDKNSHTILEVAAKGGFLPVVQLLISCNAEVNAALIRDASTALQAAAQGGHFDVVECLLHEGANIATKRFDGKTAKDLASENKHDKIVDLLLLHQTIVEGPNFNEAFFPNPLTE